MRNLKTLTLATIVLVGGAFGGATDRARAGSSGALCMLVEVLSIDCDPASPGDYSVTVSVTNTSGVDAEHVKILGPDTDLDGLPDYPFMPDTWNTSVPNGTTTLLTTTVQGVAGAVLCFELWLLDSSFAECCTDFICVDLPPCGDEPEFVRCDCNRDGSGDIGDAIFTLGLLFMGGTPSCADACDSNDDGSINIADVIYCLSILFTGGPPPPPPYPGCGPDPTPDALRCDSYPLCP
ncbi:MAG: hypothetical protein KDC38_16210 [Planctomycetes bacterium]|nr:hypothetical protein [Planctomycetota bacterium]